MIAQFKRQPGLMYPITDEIIERANKINEKVAEYFGTTIIKLASKSHKREIVAPRQMSMYLIRQETCLPDKKIGEMFNRDRTTVIHAVSVIKNELDPITGENYCKKSIQQLKLIIQPHR